MINRLTKRDRLNKKNYKFASEFRARLYALSVRGERNLQWQKLVFALFKS